MITIVASPHYAVKLIGTRDIEIVLDALWDASCWQDSLYDAHHGSLRPSERTQENTAIAKRAEKQSTRYLKLHDKMSSLVNACAVQNKSISRKGETHLAPSATS